MSGGFTRVEETLLRQPLHAGDRGGDGRTVVAVMSSHQRPDLLGEIFVLDAADVLEPQ